MDTRTQTSSLTKSDSVTLIDLPDDILFRIFLLCNGDDVAVFEQVCRRFRAVSADDYLWKELFQKRHGYLLDTENGDIVYRREYENSDELVLSVAEDCEIAHGTEPYWSRVRDPRSIFGQVALLNAVSWLHIQGELHGVHTGRYNVIWRMFVLPRAQYIFDITFRAESLNGAIEAQLPSDSNLLEFGSDYFDFVMPEQLEISQPFDNIYLECKNTSREWKSNIALCSVRLEAVGPNSRRWIHYVSRASVETTGLSRPRKIKFLRSQPGVVYRPWRPWITSSWIETLFIFSFCILCIAVFAELLISRTK